MARTCKEWFLKKLTIFWIVHANEQYAKFEKTYKTKHIGRKRTVFILIRLTWIFNRRGYVNIFPNKTQMCRVAGCLQCFCVYISLSLLASLICLSWFYVSFCLFEFPFRPQCLHRQILTLSFQVASIR